MQNKTKMPKGESIAPAISLGVLIGKTMYKTNASTKNISRGVIIFNRFPNFIV